jgi:hypothetical protein
MEEREKRKERMYRRSGTAPQQNGGKNKAECRAEQSFRGKPYTTQLFQ